MDFEYIPTPVFAIKDGIIKEGNLAFFKLLNYDGREIIGKDLLDFVSDESQEFLLKAFRECPEMETGNNCIPPNIEIKIKCRGEIHKYINLSLQKFVRGNMNNWFLISAHDSTHYNEMNEMLKIREAQYKVLLDNMDEEVTIEDPQGKIIYANDTFCRYYGISHEQAIGRAGTDVVIPEDRHLYEQIHELTPENPDYRLVCRVKRVDGSIVWVEGTGKGFFDESGKLIECQEVARDITELKNKELMLANKKLELEKKVAEKTKELTRANEQLIAFNNYLDNILQNISEGVAVFNQQGKLQTANNALKKNWENLLPEFTNTLSRMLISEKDSFLGKLINEGISFSEQEMLISSNGKSMHCLISGSPLTPEPNGIKRCILIIRPISEVRQLVSRFSGFQARFRFEDIVTCSESMQDVIKYAQSIADNQSNIMIEGESGTGKEMFAQAIHNASSRCNGPFIAVNCGAIPGELIGSELFGYSDGSFTGAKRGGKPGKFELATGGTIFLDEIGDMPLAQQISLLRVIQERKLMRIGDDREIPIDTRIVCATNKNLYQEVQNGKFREDLYYRLNVMHLRIPPLRERLKDLPILINYFIKKNLQNHESSEIRVSDEVLAKFYEYSWPGNVRELQNIVERMMYMAISDHIQVITLEYLREHIFKDPEDALKNALHETANRLDYMTATDENSGVLQGREKYKQLMEDAEKELLLETLSLCEYNVSMTARKLNLSRKTVYGKIKKYGLGTLL